jgi:hypothetical protein
MGSSQGDNARHVRLGHKFERRFAFRRPRTNNGFSRGFLLGGDDRKMRFNDSGFFSCDRFEGMAQPFLMIVADGREDRNDRSNCIGGILSSAETGLERDHFAFVLFEMIECERSRYFEKCRMRVPIPDPLAKTIQPAGDFIGRDHFAVHPNALAVGDEVGGDEKTGAVVRRAANGIDHGADRAFAVGAGHVDDSLIFSRNVQVAEQALDIFEPELDPEALGSVKPGERLVIS